MAQQAVAGAAQRGRPGPPGTTYFRAGRRGAGNRRELKPNSTYVEKRTGFIFRTDAQGRVASFSGRLQSGHGRRDAYQQRVSGRGDRLPTDQGGHLFAHIFRGPGSRINLVPMNSTLNQGAWRNMERQWDSALRGGGSVNVTGTIRYDPGSQRPTGFRIKATVAGRIKTYDFTN